MAEPATDAPTRIESDMELANQISLNRPQERGLFDTPHQSTTNVIDMKQTDTMLDTPHATTTFTPFDQLSTDELETKMHTLLATESEVIQSKRAGLDRLDTEYEEKSDWHHALSSLNARMDGRYKMYFANPIQPRRIMTSLTVKRIGDIDMRSQSFHALFHVYLTWLPTRSEFVQAEKCNVEYWSNHRLVKWLTRKKDWLEAQGFDLQHIIAFQKNGIDGHDLTKALDMRSVLRHKGVSLSKEEFAAFYVLFKEAQRDYLAEFEPEFVPRLEARDTIHINKHKVAEYHKYGKYRVQKFSKFSPILEQQDRGYDLEYLANSRWIRMRVDFDIIFSEELELENFPFDCQDLTLYLRENTGRAYCVLTPELRSGEFFSCDPTNFAMQEYNMEQVHFEIRQRGNSGRGGREYSEIYIRIKVNRHWRYYIWTVWAQMFLITGFTMGGFVLDKSNLGERMAVIVTLMLTAVAFQDVVQNQLPNTPYMTMLDAYVLCDFGFMGLVFLETALIEYIGAHETSSILWGFITLFFAYHLAFVFYIWLIAIPAEYAKLFENPITMMWDKSQKFPDRNRIQFSAHNKIERLSTNEEWYRFVEWFVHEKRLDQNKTSIIAPENIPEERWWCQCSECSGIRMRSISHHY